MLKIPHNKLFFTSDPHYWHKNILKYCDRPFETVEEMNTQLILNWNSIVPEDGEVIITGDFAFASGDKIKAILKQLNGHKHLVLGNHDHQINFSREYPYFETICETLEVRAMGDKETPAQDLFCCHYPMITWNQSHKDSWQVFGHIHTIPNNNKIKGIQSVNQYDVGVDNNNYTPVSFNKLKEIITKQNLYGIR